MSLHAQPSPEARHAFERQRSSSKTASLIISLLATTLLSLVLALFLIPTVDNDWTAEASYVPPKKPIENYDRPKLPIHSKPSAPSARATPVITAEIHSPLSIPTIEAPPVEGVFPGNGYDFGEGGIGENDSGNGPVFFPRSHRKRCSKLDRVAQIEAGGGSAEIDDRVVRALRFMKETQAADGGWGRQNRAAMTGLSLLAYLAHCETPISPEFGDSCLKAIIFLTDRGSKNQGRLADNVGEKHWPYEQAIATYALAEAETFCLALNINIPQLQEVVQQAGQLIIDSQHPSGGWDYSYSETGNRGGDLSITGWQIQALKACKLTGIDFRNLKGSVRKALSYVGERQASDGGFGYTGTSEASGIGVKSLTGVGMLSFQMWNKGSNATVRRGAKYALANMPFEWNGPDCDLYAHYYLAQAMFQRGGSDWEKYQAQIRDALMANQAADGSWPVPGGGAKPRAVAARFADASADGRHYRTALAVLTLEVYYRYLPSGK